MRLVGNEENQEKHGGGDHALLVNEVRDLKGGFNF